MLTISVERVHAYVRETSSEKLMSTTIYLDNSATTPVRPEVRAAMLAIMEELWGNPSSVHRPGRKVREAVEQARKQVAELLGCNAGEIYFTSCATHSNNMAILGRARFCEANGLGKHIITSAIEHPSSLGPARYLESRGWKLSILPVNREGLINPAALTKALTEDTSIVSLMWGNNEVGSLQPIEELAAITKAQGAFFHTDAVQIPGKLPLNLSEILVDSLSLSAHKFYGPKGIGTLFVRQGSNIMPITFGGGQEKGLCPGTESSANIAGLGKAAEFCRAELEETTRHLRTIQGYILSHLARTEGVIVTGPTNIEQRIPGHISFIVKGVEGEAIVMQADLRGVFVSSASACKKGIVQPSHVLQALGYSDEEATGSVRLTAGRLNSLPEIEQATSILLAIIENTRKSSANSLSKGSRSSSSQMLV